MARDQGVSRVSVLVPFVVSRPAGDSTTLPQAGEGLYGPGGLGAVCVVEPPSGGTRVRLGLEPSGTAPAPRPAGPEAIQTLSVGTRTVSCRAGRGLLLSLADTTAARAEAADGVVLLMFGPE